MTSLWCHRIWEINTSSIVLKDKNVVCTQLELIEPHSTSSLVETFRNWSSKTAMLTCLVVSAVKFSVQGHCRELLLMAEIG
jgi:hypothetical protein